MGAKTDCDERGIGEMAEESLYNDSVNSVLLHPLEVQVDNSLARVVVELHWLAVGCCQS